jgi:serine/threonine protein kinase
MGSVWVADHLALQTQVAIKFMAATVADDPVSVQRFSREAKAAAQIKSPHVAQVFDHGITEDGTPFIVMELLDGESLEKRLRRVGPLNLLEVTLILTQACKALAKAHEIGVVHRDLKPANLFIIESGGEPFVKVLDFGVAKFSGEQGVEMTAAGHLVGTPAFMSPEQCFDAKQVGHRADLWSLGVVAYSAMTGRRPFAGATLGELVVAVKRGGFALPSAIRGDLPPAVDEWMVKALAREPSDRFASAKEMAQALERAVGSTSIMASSPSLAASGQQLATHSSGTSLVTSNATRIVPAQRKWTWLVAGGAAMLVVVGAIGAGAVLMGRERGAASAAASGSQPEANVEPNGTRAATAGSTASAQPPESSATAAGSASSASSASSAAVPVPVPAAAPSGAHGRIPAVAGTMDERAQRAKDKLGI